MSSVVVKKCKPIRDFGETRRGWLGVRIQNLNSEVAEALGLENTMVLLLQTYQMVLQKSWHQVRRRYNKFDGLLLMTVVH